MGGGGWGGYGAKPQPHCFASSHHAGFDITVFNAISGFAIRTVGGGGALLTVVTNYN